VINQHKKVLLLLLLLLLLVMTVVWSYSCCVCCYTSRVLNNHAQNAWHTVCSKSYATKFLNMFYVYKKSALKSEHKDIAILL